MDLATAEQWAAWHSAQQANGQEQPPASAEADVEAPPGVDPEDLHPDSSAPAASTPKKEPQVLSPLLCCSATSILL